MGTTTYPALHELLRPVALDRAWRIYPGRFLDQPLGVGHGYSRFSAPQDEYRVLYAAPDFKTALREGLIRDRFDGKARRRIAEHTLRSFASACLDTVTDLALVDLRDGGATDHGIPSRVRHAIEGYEASQALALEVREDMPDADGFLFRSRLDETSCVAVFERAISSLTSPARMTLERNPLLRPALAEMRVTTFRWHGRF